MHDHGTHSPFFATTAMPSNMHSPSLRKRRTYHKLLNIAGEGKDQRGKGDIHSNASLRFEKSSTPSSRKRSTFFNAFPISESRAKPHKTKITLRPARSLCTRTNASADDRSTPATRERSTTRKRIGLSCHEDESSNCRICASTWVIVPKNRCPNEWTTTRMLTQ